MLEYITSLSGYKRKEDWVIYDIWFYIDENIYCDETYSLLRLCSEF